MLGAHPLTFRKTRRPKAWPAYPLQIAAERRTISRSETSRIQRNVSVFVLHVWHSR